jgi:hypothetical protein
MKRYLGVDTKRESILRYQDIVFGDERAVRFLWKNNRLLDNYYLTLLNSAVT